MTVAIHYGGPMSRTPGRVACDAVSPQAVAQEWHATDCDRCKTSLVGLVIERTALDMPDRYKVEAVEPYRLGLAWSDSDDALANLDWIALRDLDDYDIDAGRPAWRVVA
jgi:hypothetical protein